MTDSPSPTLFAYRSYRDAPAAVAWLESLGFEVVAKQASGERIDHAELRFGNAVVMLASFDAEYDTPPLRGNSVGQGLYLRVTDDQVDALHRVAVEGGATSVFPPEATEWGSRRARVLDPEGNEWSFGSYEPGRAW